MTADNSINKTLSAYDFVIQGKPIPQEVHDRAMKYKRTESKISDSGETTSSPKPPMVLVSERHR